MASQENESEHHDIPQPNASERAPSGSQVRRQAGRIVRDGLRFGNYKVVRLIAVGGMSEVYEAIHVGLRKRVALKVMRPDLAAHPEARRCFVAEGVNAARIRHTNVVDVTDVGVFDDLPYLVMALLDGEDLAAVYARQGRMPIPDLVDLLLPVTFAVAIGHAHGVVHRDLKPDNVFLHREGSRVIPKVLDFGVSRLLGALATRTSVFGTPYYMAPEQARGEPVDTRADQYSVGVMLYQGLTGRLPRESVDAAEVLHVVAYMSGSFAPPSRHVEIPAALDATICRAMSYDAEERFASMRDLAAALLPFASPEARQYWAEELRSLPIVGPSGRAVVPPATHPARNPRCSLLSVPVRIEQSVAPVAASAPLITELAPAATSVPPLASVASARPSSAPAPQPENAEPTAVSTKRSRTWLGLVAAAAALALAGVWLSGPSSNGGATSSVSPATAAIGPSRGASYIDVDVHVTPTAAALLLDEKQVAVGHYTARLPQDHATHELRAEAEGFVTRSIWFRDQPPESAIELLPLAAAPVVSASVTLHPTHVPVTKELVARKPLPKSVVAPPHPRAVAKASTTVASALPEQQSDAGAAGQLLRVNLVEPQQPKIRIVDPEQPHVRVID